MLTPGEPHCLLSSVTLNRDLFQAMLTPGEPHCLLSSVTLKRNLFQAMLTPAEPHCLFLKINCIFRVTSTQQAMRRTLLLKPFSGNVDPRRTSLPAEFSYSKERPFSGNADPRRTSLPIFSIMPSPC